MPLQGSAVPKEPTNDTAILLLRAASRFSTVPIGESEAMIDLYRISGHRHKEGTE